MAHTIPAAMAWTLSLLNDFFLSGLQRIIRLTLAIGIVTPGVSLVSVSPPAASPEAPSSTPVYRQACACMDASSATRDEWAEVDGAHGAGRLSAEGAQTPPLSSEA